jgi:hypothetical protein
MDYIIHKNGVVTSSNGKCLKQYQTPNGYLQVSIKINGKYTKKLVHRLVAEKYIPNNENKPCVNHKDGNKHNNNVDNLEWCTYSENELHSHRVLGKKTEAEHLRKMRNIHIKKSSKKVMQTTIEGQFVNVFESMAEASKKTGISQGNISECCHNKRRKAGGYLWNFVH